MTELVVTDARVRYGSHTAVTGVSFTLERGAALGIVGESGSGKTTLARAIVGQLPLAGGEVLVGGAPLTRRRRRLVQLVPQDPYASLNPRMTVGQTIGELLRVHALVPAQQREARITELLETVRLEADTAHGYPHEFSGGQRQRIALARALAVEPRVLVADEPTSALDVSVQRTVIELLGTLRTSLDLTLLFISHDLGVVHELCEEVLVMRHGTVIEHGSSDFFRRPTTAYGRELLSSVPRLPTPTEGEAPR